MVEINKGGYFIGRPTHLRVRFVGVQIWRDTSHFPLAWGRDLGMGFHFVWYVPGALSFPCQLVCKVIPEGSLPQHRDYSKNYQANHAPGTPLSLQLDRETPWLACKLKVAIPDRYQSLITFSNRESMGLDYGSSDYMHVTVIMV